MSARPLFHCQSPSQWKMGNKGLIISPFLQTLKGRGISWIEGGQGRAKGRTKRKHTFYVSSRGRDFRHTQVGGSHDVIVSEAIPRARGQRGPEHREGTAGHSPPRKYAASVTHHGGAGGGQRALLVFTLVGY